MTTKSGTNQIAKFREQALKQNKDMVVRQIWNNGYPTGRMEILIGDKKVAEADSLAALYGR